MTVQQCKYVLEIAKTGSFNEAAKQLFVAQSTVTNRISELEKEVGKTKRVKKAVGAKKGKCD